MRSYEQHNHRGSRPPASILDRVLERIATAIPGIRRVGERLVRIGRLRAVGGARGADDRQSRSRVIRQRRDRHRRIHVGRHRIVVGDRPRLHRPPTGLAHHDQALPPHDHLVLAVVVEVHHQRVGRPTVGLAPGDDRLHLAALEAPVPVGAEPQPAGLVDHPSIGEHHLVRAGGPVQVGVLRRRRAVDGAPRVFAPDLPLGVDEIEIGVGGRAFLLNDQAQRRRARVQPGDGHRLRVDHRRLRHRPQQLAVGGTEAAQARGPDRRRLEPRAAGVEIAHRDAVGMGVADLERADPVAVRVVEMPADEDPLGGTVIVAVDRIGIVPCKAGIAVPQAGQVDVERHRPPPGVDIVARLGAAALVALRHQDDRRAAPDDPERRNLALAAGRGVEVDAADHRPRPPRAFDELLPAAGRVDPAMEDLLRAVAVRVQHGQRIAVDRVAVQPALGVADLP